MSYTPTNWQTGDVITAEKLNKMEGGIAAGSATGLITSSDDFQTIDQSYNDIVAMVEAGLIPHYGIYGQMYYLNEVQEIDQTGEGDIVYEAYFTFGGGAETTQFSAYDPSVPMENADVQAETGD